MGSFFAAWRATLLLSAVGGVLRADETWLQPEQAAVTPGARLALDLTKGDGFNGPEGVVLPERVARIIGRVGGGDVVLVGTPVAGEKSLRFEVTLPRPGVAVLGVELKPRVLELEPEKIEPYFRMLHAGGDLRALWNEVPEPRRWREASMTHAKAFARVGEPAAGEQSWTQPLGLALEIMPERDPTALRAGDTLPIRVLRRGAPFPGFVLAFVSAGGTREHVRATDAEGRAAAKLDVAGLWLVHGADLRRATVNEREWDSDFTTMVIEVGAAANGGAHE